MPKKFDITELQNDNKKEKINKFLTFMHSYRSAHINLTKNADDLIAQMESDPICNHPIKELIVTSIDIINKSEIAHAQKIRLINLLTTTPFHFDNNHIIKNSIRVFYLYNFCLFIFVVYALCKYNDPNDKLAAIFNNIWVGLLLPLPTTIFEVMLQTCTKPSLVNEDASQFMHWIGMLDKEIDKIVGYENFSLTQRLLV